MTATHDTESVQAAYQRGVQAAATAFHLMVSADYTPDQVARSVRDWLGSHGHAWNPAGHGFPVMTAGDIAMITDAWFMRYRHAHRVDEGAYLALRNRLLPLAPGAPVQFQELGQRRWFNGTLEGPVDNPDDPRRSGDVIVLSRSGRRVTVFLSGVRRRS